MVRGGLGLGTSAGADIAAGSTNAVGVDAIARQGGDIHILGHNAGARTEEGLDLGVCRRAAQGGFGEHQPQACQATDRSAVAGAVEGVHRTGLDGGGA